MIDMGDVGTKKKILRILRQSKLNYTSVMNLSIQTRIDEAGLKADIEELSEKGLVSVMSSGHIALTQSGIKAINNASEMI